LGKDGIAQLRKKVNIPNWGGKKITPQENAVSVEREKNHGKRTDKDERGGSEKWGSEKLERTIGRGKEKREKNTQIGKTK